MQATADQVCWVPIESIVDEWGEEHTPCMEAQGATVLLASRGDGRYTLLAGRERLCKLREQGQGCVDAVLSPTELLEARLSELLDKLMRGELHYLDEAEEYRSLLCGTGVNAQELATRIGRSVATVRKKLRLLNLGDEVSRFLREHGFCERYAQELLRVPGLQGRLRVLAHVAEHDLTVKETEKLIDDVLAHMPVPITGGRRMKPLMRDYRLYLNAIRGIVEQMRDAGLDANIQVTVGRRVAEVRVSVPLFQQGKQE
ncbi:MAG: hypothetical protein RR653_05630 [Clostridia bacterium]